MIFDMCQNIFRIDDLPTFRSTSVLMKIGAISANKEECQDIFKQVGYKPLTLKTLYSMVIEIKK
jgi:hypothetical protein